MKSKTSQSLLIVALFGSLSAVPVMADHNSVWGAGKANMPNDIHNTRIEEANTGLMTAEEWREFVSKGAGAETVNRYLDDAEILPSETARNAGAERTNQVERGGRPDAPNDVSSLRAANAAADRPATVTRSVGMIDRPTAALREMNASFERPASVSRGGRR